MSAFAQFLAENSSLVGGMMTCMGVLVGAVWVFRTVRARDVVASALAFEDKYNTDTADVDPMDPGTTDMADATDHGA